MIESELEDLFKDRPPALEYLLLFNQYCDLLDDQIDEGKSNERTRKISQLAAQISNSSFWCQYRTNLYLLERTINNAYFDSLRWERSEEKFKREISRVLASTGIMMIVAVIMIEFGEEVANEWSVRLREFYYEKHKNDANI